MLNLFVVVSLPTKISWTSFKLEFTSSLVHVITVSIIITCMDMDYVKDISKIIQEFDR